MAIQEHQSKSKQIESGFFQNQIDRLEAGFPQARVIPLPDKTVKLFYDRLKRFSAKALSEAIDTIIDEDDFFPSLARIRRLAESNERPEPIDWDNLYGNE